MVPLVRACARTLEGMLGPECVAEVWEASHVHLLDRLKTKCLRFIIDNYGVVKRIPVELAVKRAPRTRKQTLQLFACCLRTETLR